MEKRLLLAIVLSLAVLVSWSAFVAKTQHIDMQDVTHKTVPARAVEKPLLPESVPLAIKEPPASSLIEFGQEEYDIVFIESQAAIKEVVFKSYQNYHFPVNYGLLLADPALLFTKKASGSGSISFIHRDAQKEITKEFYFHNSSYNIELVIRIRNLSNSQLILDLPLLLGSIDLGKDAGEARLKDATFASKDKITHITLSKDIMLQDAKFMGMRDRYFCLIAEPVSDGYSGFIKKIGTKEFEIGLTTRELTLPPETSKEIKFAIYLGPQELRYLNETNPEWSAIMYYGTFDFIGHILLQILDFIFGLVHNWGTTIIILSILIYLVLYPLTMKQMHSMKKMQSLQPRIEELRKIYKDNPQKLNTEIMGLYREYKVNPLSGCLPLILQIPVFFALYQVLMRSVALKGAKFLWIQDLSAPDRLFTLPVSLPVLGNEVNLLPILMTIGMFIQQKYSMTAGSTGSAEQQKLMMIIFPLMFGFIFYRMPSGLVLYWFINSTLMLIYQLRISRHK